LIPCVLKLTSSKLSSNSLPQAKLFDSEDVGLKLYAVSCPFVYL